MDDFFVGDAIDHRLRRLNSLPRGSLVACGDCLADLADGGPE
jgi:hypothetical protein